MTDRHHPHPDRPLRLPVTTRHPRTATLLLGLALGATALTGCSLSASSQQQDLTPATTAAPVTFTYTGAVQTYVVPDGVTSLTITGSGGAGGEVHAGFSDGSSGAEVTGTVQVQPGQQLLVSVAGKGANAGTKKHDPAGGWGGLGATGGKGNAATDYLRTSGAGGGATVVQLAAADGSDPQTILVAGGGGGDGAPSGDQTNFGGGGWAGCTGPNSDNSIPSWEGANGENASDLHGGKGGAAGAAAAGAGSRGKGGSGLGGNGGGGGGGLLGGGPGTGASGTSAGGGGGAGTSGTAGMTETGVSCHSKGGNGQVQVTPGSPGAP